MFAPSEVDLTWDAGLYQTSCTETMIDAFKTATSLTAVTDFLGNSTPDSSSVTGNDMIGGERDAYTDLTSGALVAQDLQVGDSFVTEPSLAHSQPATGAGFSYLVWDGPDGNPDPFSGIDYTGLGNADLTDSGRQDVFVIRNFDIDQPMTLTLEIYTDASNWSNFVLSLPITGTIDLMMPFSGFATQAGGGADFSDVGAIVLYMDGRNNVKLDLTMQQILAACTTASLGDYVWVDTNIDGLQNDGNTGLNGVTVELYRDVDGDGIPEPGGDDGALYTNTVTINDGGGNPGYYIFASLPADDYFVRFIPPAGYALTLQDQGINDTVDSDADPSTGVAAVTTLIMGEHDPTWDAGLYQLASLGNYVWEDFNADGIQNDGSSSGINGVTVWLYRDVDGDGVSEPGGDDGVAIATTVTANDGGGDPGYYLFSSLVADDYFVVFDTPPFGYVTSPQDQGGDDGVDSDADPATGIAAVTTLSIGESDLTWDAGDAGRFQALRLGNRVWDDLDDDGFFNGLEVGIDNVLVELRDSTGTVVLATTTTSGGGFYQFTSLISGTYVVNIPGSNFANFGDPLFGFVSSTDTYTSDDTVDSNDSGINNLDPANGGVRGGAVTLIADTEPTTEGADEDGSLPDANSNLTVDFGFFELLTLGNVVWFDVDDDGIFDGSESGIPSGIVLNLLDGSGNPVLHPISNQPITTMTGAGGFYYFTNLYPGDYIVQIDPANFQVGGPLELYRSSTGSVDPDDDVNSDDNGNDGSDPPVDGISSSPVTLNYNTEPISDADTNNNTNLAIDFGLYFIPDAVTLLYFQIDDVSGQQVTLVWETAAEIDNFGFRLYRASENDFARAGLIHFEPSSIGGNGPGAAYSFVDSAPTDGEWWYWLADVDTQGLETVHNAISALVGPDSMPHKLYLPFVARQASAMLSLNGFRGWIVL